MEADRKAGILWFRRFVRALLVLVAPGFAAVVLLVAVLSRPVVYDRLGLVSRALTPTLAHLPLAAALAVSVAAGWAARAGKRARSAKVGALALAGLLLAELVMNVRGVHQYVTGVPELGWWHGEDAGGRIRYHTDMFGVTRAITPEGLRGAVPVPRAFAGARVICLGDSFTWGAGTEDGNDWPAVASRLAGLPFLNAGNLGYGVDQMATFYSTRLVRFDHTAVIVCAIDDDLRRAADRFFLARRKPFTFPGGDLELVHPPRSLFGIAWSPESQVLAPWLESGRHVLREVGLLPDRWVHLDDALARIRRTAGARKAFLLSLSTRGDAGRYGPRMSEAAIKAGFEGAAAVDLTGAYAPDGHPDTAGHARIAATAVQLINGKR